MQKQVRTVLAPALILLALCGLWQGGPAQAQLLQRAAGSRLGPMPGSRVWGGADGKDLIFPLHDRARVRPSYLLIGRDHPNGTRFLAVFPGYGVNLPLRFGGDFGGFDEYGDLKKGYRVQVAEHDFGHDGLPEVIIAVGDGLTDLSVNVIRYHPPRSVRDAGRAANWSLIGSYRGQAGAEIGGDTIQIPIGSQGLYDEYTWVKGRFVKTE